MHVLIGVFRQQVAMAREFVLDLYLNGASWPGMVVPLRVVHRDIEIVLALESAGDGLAGGQSDGPLLGTGGAAASATATESARAGPDEARLQLIGLHAGSNLSEV